MILTGILLNLILSCNDFDGNEAAQIGSSQENIVGALIKRSQDDSLNVAQRYALLGEAMDIIHTSDSLDRPDLYNDLAFAFFKLKDSTAFRRVNREAKTLALSQKDTTALANAHWDLALFLKGINVLDSAYFHYAEAEQYYAFQGNLLRQSKMLRNMAKIQTQVKDYIGSENNLLKAINLVRSLGDDMENYRIYNTLGITALNLKDYQQALDYHVEALEYLKKLDSEERKYWLPYTLNNIGLVYYEMGEYEKARNNFEKVVSDPEFLQNDLGTFARALNNLGLCRLKLEGKYTDPDPFYHSLAIKDSIGDLTGLSRVHYSLAEFYMVRGDTAEALHSALKAKNFAERSDNKERLLASLDMLTRLDKPNAHRYSSQYIAMNDSLLLAERRTLNKFGRIEFRTNEFIAQNELLERQRALLLWIVVGLGLLAVSVFIIVQQRVRNQKLRNQQQQQAANQEIFELMLSQNQKKEEGKKQAQKRISQELHDGILGQINGIRMLLLGLNKKSDETAIQLRNDAIHKLQDVQEEIRTLSHELNSAVLQKVDNFIHSLDELLDSTAEPAGLKHTLEYSSEMEWDDLQSDYKINLYRISQELLQNTIKYAEAASVRMELDREDNQIVFTFEDDGKGFDQRKGKKGIGHKNIASRVADLGGHWKIKSNIGKGTKVSILLPYKSPLSGLNNHEVKPKILEKA